MATMSTPTQFPDSDDTSAQPIPSLLFDNRTDYDALHFDTLDQHGTAFHVVVAKIGYTLGSCDAHGTAQLTEAGAPAALNVEDIHYEDKITCSVRQESDLAPYKPYCDVIVNAQACAPNEKPVRRFQVALQVQLPDEPAPLPERPQSLNPLMELAPDVFETWQKDVARASVTRVPSPRLLDKKLEVSGERHLRKKNPLARLLQSCMKWGTFGRARPNPWTLTPPQEFIKLPLRYEWTAGGQCRIELNDAAAQKVPAKHRLTAEQRDEHPDKEAAPIAHDTCMTNPLGRGFARDWYLRATRLERLPAPRIENPAEPFTATGFWQAVNGNALSEPAGLGPIGRAWLPRQKLVGNMESKTDWNENEVPHLPADFDFRYWNGAPLDQQCRYPEGDERFTLTNLCSPNAPFAHQDTHGNTVVRFSLPRQSLFLLAADEEEQISVHPLVIDTVTIDLEAGQVDLTWRVCLPADGEIHEARLLHAKDEQQLQRLKELQTPSMPDHTARPSEHLSHQS